MTPTQDTITARLEELLAGATPGPWQADDADCGAWGVFADGAQGDCDAISYMVEPTTPGWSPLRPEQDEANAALIVEAINALPALLSERATLKAELEEARGLLEPFANERLSMEPTVSDCLLRSAGAEMRLAAEKLDARDNAIRAARAYLTKEPTNGR